MAGFARVVIAGHPHHVTQRGNGRARTFFSDADYALYRDLLGEHYPAAVVTVWAWCLMPNHVHLRLVPFDEDSLRRALAPVRDRVPDFAAFLAGTARRSPGCAPPRASAGRLAKSAS